MNQLTPHVPQIPSSVLIVGAGPTGLVLALWLTRLGVSVRIIDKNSAPGTTSRALVIHARTLEFYRQLGIVADVLAAGRRISFLNLWVKGRPVAGIPFQDIGKGLSRYPFLLVYPQDIHEEYLVGKLAESGIQVEREMELIRFQEVPSGIKAFIRRSGGIEEMFESSYLAGCDGAHSTVREALGTGFPGGTYAQLFYVADVEAEGPPVDGELHVDLDESELLAVFPMKEKGQVRLIGTVREEPGSPVHDLTFANVSERILRGLNLKVNEVNWFSTYHVHHRVTGKFRVGRAFLLGDAAHIHSPAGGQGMNTGIGDAVNLAWKLADVIKNGAPPTLLDSYEPERIGFARKLVVTTDQGFNFATRQGPLAGLVRTVFFPPIAARAFKLTQVRRFAFRTVSQIAVNYRGGPLSEGTAGRIRAGDRLPWMAITPKEDNFEPLSTLAWQVHVYGAAADEFVEACASLQLQLHVFPWTSEMKRCGFARDACYLIRPDGHVALADKRAESGKLIAYLAGKGIVIDRGTHSRSALKPNPAELDACFPWVAEKDANPGWPKNVEAHFSALKKRLGYG